MILFGTRTVLRQLRGGVRLMRLCGRCGTVRELVEHTARRYFTVYFVPLCPVEAGEHVLKCAHCGATYHHHPRRADRDPAPPPTSPVKRIRTCPRCQQRLRVPSSSARRLTLACPRCGERFSADLA